MHETIDMVLNDPEEIVLEKLSELSGRELMELQNLADKITDYVLVVLLARGIIREQNND